MDPIRSRLEQSLAGKYRVERELGGGAMSRTYVADEPALQRRVVIKVLAPELLEGLSVERFKREVLTAASLQHPHVVPVLATGDADGLPWFSMPYVEGDSLRQRLAQGALPIGEAVAILRDVARALAYAHGHGIVHRDIKPDNVLLSAGSATVTDFGIAKAISASRLGGPASPAGAADAPRATLTQAGFAIGTPGYMAPEQAEDASAIDHRADLYAFGAMAFELLTGRLVFPAPNAGRMLVAHLTETPSDPRALRPDIPAPLAVLVLQCLAKAPAARPADAAALVQALDGLGVALSDSLRPGLATGGAVSATEGAPVRGRMDTEAVPLASALGTWAVGAAALVGGVFVASQAIGVPSWTMPSALALAGVGLPVVLGSWWVQRRARRLAARPPQGTLDTLALRAQPYLLLHRVRRLGAAAGAAFALLVGGFLASRAYGLGPGASLISAGEFDRRERLMVADFRPPAGDPGLGGTVAEALRTDLAQSPNLAVLTRPAVAEVLQRMQRSADAAVPYTVAREIAQREGVKAVLDGDVLRLGAGYVLSARLVSARDGRELATFRETARDDAALIPAIGALSRRIREKVGESLRGVQASKPLERVSTSSLAALRKYAEARQARIEEASGDRYVALLREAVALDSGFAMAWRAIASHYVSVPTTDDRYMDAIARAYRFRDRLTDDERDLIEGDFFSSGPNPDPARAIAAYERLLERDSTHIGALSGLHLAYDQNRQYDRALAVARRKASLPGMTVGKFMSLMYYSADLGDSLLLDSAVAAADRQFPGVWRTPNFRDLLIFLRLQARGRLDSLAVVVQQEFDTTRFTNNLWVDARILTGNHLRRGRIEAALDVAEAEARRLKRLDPGVAGNGFDLFGLGEHASIRSLYDRDGSRARGTLRRMLQPEGIDDIPPVRRPWLNGLWTAAVLGDADAAGSFDRLYARDNASGEAYRGWAESLRSGLLALARGKHREAAARLQEAGRQRTTSDIGEAYLIALAFDRGGLPDSAITWLERVLADPLRNGYFNWGYAPLAHRRLGELYDARGDVPRALTHYTAFAELWRDADPAQQPVVRAVRARIGALRAKSGGG